MTVETLPEEYQGAKNSEDGRRIVAIRRFLYTWAIVAGCDDIGFDDRWCYATYREAQFALDNWSGNIGTEPTGWHRHPSSGRRRPDGDATKEYINP